MSDRTKEHLWLLAAVCIALVLRLHGIGFGLPNTECRPDETTVVLSALRFFSGDFNPHQFNYPSLVMYLVFAVYAAYFAACRVLFHVTSDAMLAEIALSPARFYLMARLVSAVLGALTLVPIHHLVRRLFGRREAVIAALFLAVAHLHVRDSHYGTTDVAMAFLSACTVLCAARLAQTGAARDYALAGLLAGLATSAKYGGMFLAAPCAAAHLLRAAAEPRRPAWLLRAAFDRRAWLAAACALAAFVATTPFSVLDFRKFAADFAIEMAHQAGGHGTDLGRGWVYHARYTLPLGLGWGLFAAALAGAITAFRRNPRGGLVFLLFPVVYYAVAGRGLTVFTRYMVPVVPLLCASAAVFVTEATRVLRLPERLGTVLLCVLLGAPTAATALRTDALLARTDSRLLAADWIARRVPPGSTLYHSCAVEWGQIQLPWTLRALEARLAQVRSRGGSGALIEPRIAHARQAGAETGYEEWVYPGGPLPADPRDWPQWIVLYDSPLAQYTEVPEPIRRLVDASYTLRQVFRAAGPEALSNWYDQLDAYYLPFSGFRDVERPGPNIAIYQLDAPEAPRGDAGNWHSDVSSGRVAPAVRAEGQ